jgi:threonine synthase
MFKSYISHLECAFTGKKSDAFSLTNLSEAGKPYLVRYNLEQALITLTKESLHKRRTDMWRYHEVMPYPKETPLVSLNEGGTPLRVLSRLGHYVGMKHLFMKDESVNPTGSFKARGISAAVTAAIERGAKAFAIPTAGNAGGALASYAALAGIPAFIFMPADTPKAFRIECEAAGAHVTLVDGLISDCGKIVAQRKEQEGWFDVSTLKEPYRIEGKKTMGYELAEQFEFELPDVIIYPTGGGTGLIGMWKAFDEMEKLGWINAKRPRMVSVQTSGCAPIVKAWEEGSRHAEYWQGAHTCASGLRVPAAIGDFLILDAIRESNGVAIAVDDEEMMHQSRKLAKYTGIFPAPEGGACLAALLKMKEKKLIDAHERVVLFNTGTGYKYLEAFEND